jgi:7-cyano-7-deazaguanine synthase in queuosine biosynthesis
MKEILLHARVGQERVPIRLRRKYRVLTVSLSHGRHAGHFNTDVLNLRNLCGQRWHSGLFDLLNVMCAVRAADRYFTSTGLFHVRRRMHVAVGVTDVRHWKSLRPALTNAVAKLSRDMLHFYPIKIPKRPQLALSPPCAKQLGLLSSAPEPDSVCLFSGGADSFCGAAYLLSRRRRPVLVSQSIGPVSGLQRRLFEALRTRFPSLPPDRLVQIRTHPNATKIARENPRARLRWASRDKLQRLRSMFFFSLAGIVAQANDVDEIFMCENGIIGAAIVFAPIDDTPYTTRPAEPHFLRAMQDLLRSALARPRLTIRNPFQYMTKGQVLSLASDMGLRDSLYRTVSCWRSGNCGIRNCGQCAPCLFRQLAFDEAALPPAPQAYAYRHPIPRRDWRRWNSHELPRLIDIREYCDNAVRIGIARLMCTELAVVDAIDVTCGSGSGTPTQQPETLDSVAPHKMARAILRFARATLRRLH